MIKELKEHPDSPNVRATMTRKQAKIAYHNQNQENHDLNEKGKSTDTKTLEFSDKGL